MGVPSPELFSVPDSASEGGASLRNPRKTAGLDFPLPWFCLTVDEATFEKKIKNKSLICCEQNN